MTPSEKEKIIKEGFDAIRKVYNLRDDLLEDAGKLEAVRESNRKLSDRVANLEVTIKTLNAAIDKKDVEIRALKATNEALEPYHVIITGKGDTLFFDEWNGRWLRIKTFTDWINYIFGDFGVYDEEE